MSKRVFVKVIIDVDTVGKITPIQLTWPDGREFPIDRVLDIRPAPAKSGGSGIRYLCRIQGREVPLYQDQIRGAWWCDGKEDVS
jgi:hypothetical protein